MRGPADFAFERRMAMEVAAARAQTQEYAPARLFRAGSAAAGYLLFAVAVSLSGLVSTCAVERPADELEVALPFAPIRQ